MEVRKGDLVCLYGGRYGLVCSTHDYTDEQGWECQKLEVWYLDDCSTDYVGVGSVSSVICHTDYNNAIPMESICNIVDYVGGIQTPLADDYNTVKKWLKS